MTLQGIVLFIGGAIALFIIVVLACCFALGRMHRWLRDRGEAFGNGAKMHQFDHSVKKGPWGPN